jgi:Cu(I)/Ag(I) efflux system periplasmic protein CusF
MEFNMRKTPILVSLSLALAGAFGGQAFAASDAPVAAAAASSLTNGEIRKIDTAQGKVTIRHEAIQNLDMPPMTMVFRVGNPELLAKAQVGDKIQFRAENSGGAMVVTDIQRAK